MTNLKQHTHLKTRLTSCAIASVLAGTCVIGVCGNNETANACESDLMASTTTQTCKPMYRLYNPYTGEHFYTDDLNERDNTVKAGWKNECVGWYAPQKSNTPVYRLYNPYVYGGDHHYTISANEKDNLTKLGWRYEGVGWYSDDKKSVELLRQYNPFAQTGTHNYTASTAENKNLISLKWRGEGIAWYAVKGANANHSFVSVYHPKKTHEEDVYETKVTSAVYCNVHKVKWMTDEERDADPEQIGWCPADKNCLAPCQRVYSTEKVKTGTKTVVDCEAYTDTYCIYCNMTK